MSVRCSGGVVWHAVCAGLPALAIGALSAWALGHAGWSAIPALAATLFAALVAWPLTRTVPVALAWDGQHWTADGVPGTLGVMVDAGAGLLLRLQPVERRLRSRWVAVTAREAGPSMHALRAAAYARPPSATPVPGVGPGGLPLAL